MFHDKRVLITGGLGFIGSNLARRLLELGAEVTLVDSLIPDYGGNLFNVSDIKQNVTINIADVRDEHSMSYLVRDKDYLFNLAGQTSHMDSMVNPRADLEINCAAQLSILEACRKNNPHVRIVFASTRQIYGHPRYLPVDEEHLLGPVDVNGVNKMAGEWYHILYHRVYGILACSLRLTNTYGPRMRVKDARQTFLGLWIRLSLEGKLFEVWGGAQRRDFTYVDDAVEALILAAVRDEAKGEIFNVGGDCVVSLAELANVLTSVVGRSARYSVVEFPPERKRIDIGDYYCDDRKIRSRLGWTPKVSLNEGLARTVDFYRSHLAHYI